ncbi:MAG TPA: hypothetical protein VHR66_23895 [Gemmataceae bacterium]|jgi:hypothetical protein|nr:hypothetical protein [Gemmataceae bacterium]
MEVTPEDPLECGAVTPLSFCFLVLEEVDAAAKNDKAKESGVTSPHSKLAKVKETARKGAGRASLEKVHNRQPPQPYDPRGACQIKMYKFSVFVVSDYSTAA